MRPGEDAPESTPRTAAAEGAPLSVTKESKAGIRNKLGKILARNRAAPHAHFGPSPSPKSSGLRLGWSLPVSFMLS